MRYLSLLLFLFFGHSSFGQDKNILQYKKYFDQELKQWTKSFSNFNLSDFKVEDTLHFDNNYEQDFNSYRKFLSIYKPIITYSTDSSKFIDIYSYQINLEKKGAYFKANPDIDQAVLLCYPKTKYWNRIYFGTSSQWIDEVIWISKTKFILVGIIKSEDEKKKPLLLFGDTNKQTLIKIISINKNSFQNDKGYSSPKLKKLHIKGL
ncbi:MAG: hypothetical protein ACK4E8_03685 [Lacibacter sp.]